MAQMHFVMHPVNIIGHECGYIGHNCTPEQANGKHCTVLRNPVVGEKINAKSSVDRPLSLCLQLQTYNRTNGLSFVSALSHAILGEKLSSATFLLPQHFQSENFEKSWWKYEMKF